MAHSSIMRFAVTIITAAICNRNNLIGAQLLGGDGDGSLKNHGQKHVHHSSASLKPEHRGMEPEFMVEQELLERIKVDSYRQTMCPSETQALRVKVSADINYIELREDRDEFGTCVSKCRVDMTLRQKWNNPRLMFNNSERPDLEYVGLNNDENLWFPDISFPGDTNGTTSRADGDNVDHSQKVVWLYPNGDVFYSVRYHLEFATTSSAYRRNQNRICTIPIESYRCSTKTLILEWDEKEPVQMVERIGVTNVQITGNADLYHMRLMNVIASRAMDVPVRSFGGMGSFSFLYTQILFEGRHKF